MLSEVILQLYYLKAIQLESSNDILRIIQDAPCNDLAFFMRSLILMLVSEVRLRFSLLLSMVYFNFLTGHW